MQHTVVIDIGHYLYSTGAVTKDFQETELNLSIALATIEDLQRHGIKVITSSGSLENRVNIANKVKPTFFVSIHNNAGGGDGSEVLVYKNEGTQKELADNIMLEIENATLNNSRGVRERPDLYVLRKTTCTAVLVECAFMDSKDIEAIDTEAEQKAFGVAIAKGILKTLNIDYIEDKKIFYRVSVASYQNKDTAELLKQELINKGYKDSFITIIKKEV